MSAEPSADPKPAADPRSAAIERLAAAQETLASKLAEVGRELHSVDERRGAQLVGLKRQVWGLVGGLGIVLATLMLVVSAVMPGVPLLRVNERGTAATAKAVFDLQCTTLWANGYRLAACAEVNAKLSQVTGQP